jgi:hypothetical protein
MRMETRMNTTRLFVDGVGVGWAVVRCEVCANINKYPALSASNAPVKCTACGTVMDLRRLLTAAAAKSPTAPSELLNALGGAGGGRWPAQA